jgi:hypothetical protein
VARPGQGRSNRIASAGLAGPSFRSFVRSEIRFASQAERRSACVADGDYFLFGFSHSAFAIAFFTARRIYFAFRLRSLLGGEEANQVFDKIVVSGIWHTKSVAKKFPSDPSRTRTNNHPLI